MSGAGTVDVTIEHGDFRIYIHDRDLVMECACGWRCPIRTLQSGESLETYISGEEIRDALARHERETGDHEEKQR